MSDNNHAVTAAIGATAIAVGLSVLAFETLAFLKFGEALTGDTSQSESFHKSIGWSYGAATFTSIFYLIELGMSVILPVTTGDMLAESRRGKIIQLGLNHAAGTLFGTGIAAVMMAHQAQGNCDTDDCEEVNPMGKVWFKNWGVGLSAAVAIPIVGYSLYRLALCAHSMSKGYFERQAAKRRYQTSLPLASERTGLLAGDDCTVEILPINDSDQPSGQTPGR